MEPWEARKIVLQDFTSGFQEPHCRPRGYRRSSQNTCTGMGKGKGLEGGRAHSGLMEGSEVAAGVQEISEEGRSQQLSRREDQADKISDGSGSRDNEINGETCGIRWKEQSDLSKGE